MKKLLKSIAFLSVAAIAFSACTKEVAEPTDMGQPETTITRAGTRPMLVCYLEVNDTNPLNAGSYIKSDGNPAIDIAILFAANINGPIPASTTETILHNNENVSAIVGNPAKYIKPLQDKGIKVLYGLLCNHTGLGFANLTDAQVEDFAQKVAAQVNAAGLDGVDFDDEWAKYGQNGYPYENTTSYNKLIIRLRELLPGKIISVFDIGNTGNFSTAGKAAINYGYYAYFNATGFVATPGMGLTKDKWSPIAINLRNNEIRYAATMKTNAKKAADGGYGAIMVYDLRNNLNSTTILNALVSGSQGLTVTHNGQWYTKDWI